MPARTVAKKRSGIVIHKPAINGIVSYNIEIGGEWRGGGQMYLDDYSPETLQFIWGLHDHFNRCDEEQARAHGMSAREFRTVPPRKGTKAYARLLKRIQARGAKK